MVMIPTSKILFYIVILTTVAICQSSLLTFELFRAAIQVLVSMTKHVLRGKFDVKYSAFLFYLSLLYYNKTIKIRYYLIIRSTGW